MPTFNGNHLACFVHLLGIIKLYKSYQSRDLKIINRGVAGGKGLAGTPPSSMKAVPPDGEIFNKPQLVKIS